MKHLKTYETIFGKFTKDLKKYILLKHYARASNFYTLELFSINDDNYSCTLLKHYNFETKQLQEFLNNTKSSKITNVFKFNDEVLLQSNNLNEMIEYFDMVIETEKYNL